jgi:8-oxo-dGTP pyrophosphatase MutT (NUDIX family)
LYRTVIEQLETAFRAELPGTRAHQWLAPRPRRNWPHGFNPAHIRQAAGLLLIIPPAGADRHNPDGGAADAHIVLTVRADSVRHGGQVSLPGGVVEPGETIEQAALRETHEEIALPPGSARVLGALTPIDIPVSGFRLHPIVGAAGARPPMHPSDGEVARILEVGVDQLLDPANFRTHHRIRDGRELIVPGFHVLGHEVWGATAMVLAEFLALLGWSPEQT